MVGMTTQERLASVDTGSRRMREPARSTSLSANDTYRWECPAIDTLPGDYVASGQILSLLLHCPPSVVQALNLVGSGG